MPNCQLKQLEFTAKLHSVDQYNMMIVRNVSERYHILQELRRSEERFRKIFEGTFDGMIISDHDLRVVDINPIACGILSLNKDLVLGRDIRTIMNLPKKLQDRFNRYLSYLKEEGQGNITLEVPDSRDKTRFIEISSKYKVLSNLNLTVIRNITEQVEMQEQLRKSDTLSVVGELAAGIAHEIRNPMTALKGFIQLLENSMQEDHSMYFHVIKSELQRIESIITEFLILAKPQAVQYQDSNLEKIVQETVELLNAQALLHNVQIIIHCDKDLPKIYAEPNQLKQVFINIIKNAIEVMPSGGEVVLSLTKEKDNEVKISIKDTGAGIPKNKIKKLGEPFYTTKERGTGLGLMVSFKIIREHNGTIEVDSIENEGTTFHIRLPVHHEKR
ncbi:PAS domain-containing sensor histidine kinase [Bacillus coahuilensis]|nr:ATP-binding protein [Bacillus coahuilensis]